MQKKIIKPFVVATAIIAIIVSALAFGLTAKSTRPKSANIETTNQPTLINPKAPVQIVTFEDLKCPNCAGFSNELLPIIKKKYINKGIAKYSLITLAFLPSSIPARNAALYIYEQNKNYFFPFITYLYQHQPDEAQDWATIPRLLQFARNSVL